MQVKYFFSSPDWEAIAAECFDGENQVINWLVVLNVASLEFMVIPKCPNTSFYTVSLL